MKNDNPFAVRTKFSFNFLQLWCFFKESLDSVAIMEELLDLPVGYVPVSKIYKIRLHAVKFTERSFAPIVGVNTATTMTLEILLSMRVRGISVADRR